MWSEIGSNFWEYSLSNGHKQTPFFWLGCDYYVQYYKSGRNAIKALCKNLKFTEKSVLIPTYTCETVIQPFFDEGWKVNFYSLNKDLSINETSLKHAFSSVHPSVVFVQSYFGFNTTERNACILDCKNEGAVIVEDMTQSLFSDHYLACADYYVTSFRKFLAIPDGGALISKNKLYDLPIKEADSLITKTALEAFDLKRQYFDSGEVEIKSAFRDKYTELNHLIADNTQLQSMNPLSYEILHACDKDRIMAIRQQNYRILTEAFSQLDIITSVISSNIEGCAPLYYPIYVNDRKTMQAYLANENIYCPIIWPKPAKINDLDENTQYMYEHMLCIPVDQRYSRDDMGRIVSVLKKYSQK